MKLFRVTGYNKLRLKPASFAELGNCKTVVPRYERDIPLGYLCTSPVTYHTVIYHIECDMLWVVLDIKLVYAF